MRKIAVVAAALVSMLAVAPVAHADVGPNVGNAKVGDVSLPISVPVSAPISVAAPVHVDASCAGALAVLAKTGCTG